MGYYTNVLAQARKFCTTNISQTKSQLAANEVLQASQSLAEDSQKMANTTEHLTEQLKYFKV
ncbi:hypothetical protein FCV76_12695 [Vibrio sp. F13]|nr:hypothetical protein FCV76_12695 [Vibrio sp. F13]